MDAERILEELKKRGKITDADIMEIDLSDEMKEVVDVIFLIYADPMLDNTKLYYNERSMVDCWDRESHKRWTTLTTKLMEKLGTNDPEDVKVMIGELTRINKKYGKNAWKLLYYMYNRSAFPQWVLDEDSNSG